MRKINNMKLLINIEIEDDKRDLRWHEEKGLSKELIEKLYSDTFNEFLQFTIDRELKYKLNVEVKE